MLESEDEKRYVDWCKEYGILCEKVKFVQTGYPDRLTVNSGHHIWIEFKQKGKKPGLTQLYRMWSLRISGSLAGWTDDSKIAIGATAAVLAAARLPETRNTVTAIAEQWGLVFGPRSRENEYLFGSDKNIAGQRHSLQMFDRGPLEADVQGMA